MLGRMLTRRTGSHPQLVVIARFIQTVQNSPFSFVWLVMSYNKMTNERYSATVCMVIIILYRKNTERWTGTFWKKGSITFRSCFIKEPRLLDQVWILNNWKTRIIKSKFPNIIENLADMNPSFFQSSAHISKQPVVWILVCVCWI